MKRSLSRLALCYLLAGGIITAIAAEGRFDVSKVIDKAAAETILGEPVKAPTPRNEEGKDGYYSKCNYYSTSGKKRLVIRVYQAAPGFDAQKDLEAVVENTGAMRAISGLGDKARITSGVQSGLPQQVAMLYVVKGTALITVGISGFEDEAVSADKVKSVAQKILGAL
ncbi:MAG TPA: hypothetical protein VGM62_09970 [Chthoniobacterales bacterium]|jgi:hypothetical protein